MAVDKWLRVLDTVAGLAAATRRLRSREPERPDLAAGGGLGQVETRLAGVVVAALKEAFDRDRARLDLERARMDAEQRRAEDALRFELQRQAGDRALMQGRLTIVVSVVVWITSTILIFGLPDLQAAVPRTLLALGWAALIGSMASAFVAHTAVTGWMSGHRASPGAGTAPPASQLAPWLLLAGLALTAASLLVAL
jgi:hypothetical protein